MSKRSAQRNRKVNKSMYRQGMDHITMPNQREKGRGLQVYTLSSLLGISGKNERQDYNTVYSDVPYFYLTPEDRVRISQLCTPVLGVVTSRMQRISGTNWVVNSDRKEEDRIYEHLRNIYQVYKEYEGQTDLKYVIARVKLRKVLSEKLRGILPDLSNFEQCLIRWRKELNMQSVDRCDEIWEWLQEPNGNTNWNDLVKQYVYDLMIHGTTAIYKEVQSNKVENIYVLPGGTVIPARTKYVSSQSAFFQIVAGEEPQIFYPNELSFSQYIPISARSYGLVPLEALINKVSESLMFDRLMAEQADGSKYPEKMVIINDVSPFGSIDKEMAIPVDIDEQQRVDKKLKQKVEGGVMTFTGNNATVVDLSRENTMQIQMQRQKDIRESVAMVFNMSNMEINLTGSENVSGRSTAESQQEIEQGKGVIPILALIESKFNRDILPFRYGYGYSLNAEMAEDEQKKIEIERMKLQSGKYSVNEIRRNDNLNPFEGEQYELPQGSQSDMAGQTEQEPLYMSQINRSK